MVLTSDWCDTCGEKKKSYRLDIGGGGGVYLCRKCWSKEMKWRKERNRDLFNEAKLPILPFPGDRKVKKRTQRRRKRTLWRKIAEML